ncbi:MAG TPA: PEP-CTERM sorting domain-containing protein [Tepidisphaeraceae bacterium]|jgi:hypothetical protein|nr:PEP-CTERM sorting domain-containing protein [Tepidisphaeraceae bacterium]
MSVRSFRLTVGMVGAVLPVFVASAGATYHTFKFDEVYSNPSGTIQFIELHESLGANGQNFESEAPDIFSFSGPDATSTSNREHTLTLTDLPNSNTANTFFLLGTAGYNALSGAPKADYLIPNNFFNPAGDSLQYGSTGPDGTVDQITFGALPSNLSQALQRVGTSGNTFNTGPAIANTFSNGGDFAVPEPTIGGILALAAGGFLFRRRRV